MIGWFHGRFVYGRRVQRLARHIGSLLPPGASVLDIGCGDGRVAQSLLKERPDIQVQGVDVMLREATVIPAVQFDGVNIPLPDRAVDAVMLVDVLHHLSDPLPLLKDARRVCREAVIIKDHELQGPLAEGTLKAMDWVGNARFGVSLPYNYLTPREWESLFLEVGLTPDRRVDSLGLYPFPLSLLFERSLHFIVRLGV